jgi:hypothetical protein
MSFKTHYPEMNQSKPENVQGEVSLAHYGKHYFVKTPLQLKGVGVTLEDVYTASNCNNPAKFGWNRYRVTLRAMEKLNARFDFAYELLL